MKSFLHNNGLSITLFALFLFSFTGQYLTGIREFNEDQKAHRQPTVGYIEYLGEGHFIGATFENWESDAPRIGIFAGIVVGVGKTK